ncbi:MAG: RDD family protein [Mycobacterium sp.]|nr:RDD family protein [Mycobacterium sp.]
MMPGPPASAEAICAHCGARLRPHAPYCGLCGQAVIGRVLTSESQPIREQTPAPNSAQVVGASRGVRCCCFLMDLAAMLSPALPLAIAGAILGVAQVVYVVVPVAFVAVWLWMQIWQSFTGMTFGKAMLGLRLVRTVDHRPANLAAILARSGIFVATAGLAAVPVLTSRAPADGVHDRLTALTMIDVHRGGNPLGPRPQVTLRKAPERGLNRVQSPVPLGNPGQR